MRIPCIHSDSHTQHCHLIPTPNPCTRSPIHTTHMQDPPFPAGDAMCVSPLSLSRPLHSSSTTDPPSTTSSLLYTSWAHTLHSTSHSESNGSLSSAESTKGLQDDLVWEAMAHCTIRCSGSEWVCTCSYRLFIASHVNYSLSQYFLSTSIAQSYESLECSLQDPHRPCIYIKLKSKLIVIQFSVESQKFHSGSTSIQLPLYGSQSESSEWTCIPE